MYTLSPQRSARGFTLVEVLVGASVLVIVSLGIFEAYSIIMKASQRASFSTTVTALANEQFEIIRNLPYSDVGITSGVPLGILPPTQTLTRDGILFEITTTVRNTDDPFDGVVAGMPADTSPADYKLVGLTIECVSCGNADVFSFTTRVAPRALETTSNNGALFVRVFDANGAPVQGADVHIENNATITPIIIDDTTSNDGYYQLVDVATGTNAYEISVSKPGFSSEQTYAIGDVANPNPSKPHATVATQQVTQVSFAIDELSDVSIESVAPDCSPVSGIDFSMTGSKIIGTGPDIPKYSDTHTTNGGGTLLLSDLEWDTYAFTFTDAVYDFIGSMPLLPLALTPGTDLDVTLVVAPKSARTLLVSVTDAGTGLPLTDASVRLEDGGYDVTQTAGRGSVTQTEWVGGSGQSTYTDTTRFFAEDDLTTSNAGEITLDPNGGGTYVASGWLESSTIDTGTSSDYHNISWLPQDQPDGINDSGDVRFQFATNNDNMTWDFIGPDGTSGSYYTLADSNLSLTHNGNRYARYKVFLSTASSTVTPEITDISFTYTTACLPPGQVVFTGLASSNYTLTVNRSGYQTHTETVAVNQAWQETSVGMTP